MLIVARKSIFIFFGLKCGSRKVCQRGSNFDNAFLSFVVLDDEGRKDPNTTISGPSPISETPFKWHFASVPILAQH